MSKIKRSIGTFGLTMIGLTSMVGSGWLFGSARASQIAGPAAIFSWIIGMIIILTIAMCYAEVGTMFPSQVEWFVLCNIPMVRLLDSLEAGQYG